MKDCGCTLVATDIYCYWLLNLRKWQKLYWIIWNYSIFSIYDAFLMLYRTIVIELWLVFHSFKIEIEVLVSFLVILKLKLIFNLECCSYWDWDCYWIPFLSDYCHWVCSRISFLEISKSIWPQNIRIVRRCMTREAEKNKSAL